MANEIIDAANAAYADGPTSDPTEPQKSVIRSLFALIQQLYDSLRVLIGSNGPAYATRAELYADLDWAADTEGRVYGDGTPAFNGVYKKSGAVGAGAWTRIGDLPTGPTAADTTATLTGTSTGTFIAPATLAPLYRQSNNLLTGAAGSASAYTATSQLTLASIAARQTFLFTPHVDNNAAPTLNVNSLGAIEIRDEAGASLDAGAMKGGSIYFLTFVSPYYRLLNGSVAGLNAAMPQSSDDVVFQALSSTDGAAIEMGPDARLALPAAMGTLSRLPRPEVIDRLDATGWDDYSGTLETYPGTIPTAALTFIRKDYLTSTILGIVGFGQSLAGSAADDLLDVAITTTSTYPSNALMPFVGRKPQGVTFDTLVPAYEWTGTASNATTESWATGLMNLIIATVHTKLSVHPTLVTATFSQGSRTWPQLGPGNEAWDHFAKGIRDLQRSAEKRGKRFEVMMVPILWGEQNRVIGLDAGTIRAHYLSMVRHIKALVMDITGQKMPPLIVISVPGNSNDVPDIDQPHITVPASLQGVEGIHVLNPNYIRATTSNVHLMAQDYKDLGEDLARVALEGWFGPGYCPLILRPDRIRWTDSTHFILPCSVPTPPVVVDLTGTVVTPPTWGKAGFQLFDGRTAAEITISAITAVGGSGLEGNPLINLEFALTSAPGGAPRLSYAVRNDGTGNNAGNVSGARGCIRDSSPSPKWALPIYTTIPAY